MGGDSGQTWLSNKSVETYQATKWQACRWELTSCFLYQTKVPEFHSHLGRRRSSTSTRIGKIEDEKWMFRESLQMFSPSSKSSFPFTWRSFFAACFPSLVARALKFPRSLCVSSCPLSFFPVVDRWRQIISTGIGRMALEWRREKYAWDDWTVIVVPRIKNTLLDSTYWL